MSEQRVQPPNLTAIKQRFIDFVEQHSQPVPSERWLEPGNAESFSQYAITGATALSGCVMLVSSAEYPNDNQRTDLLTLQRDGQVMLRFTQHSGDFDPEGVIDYQVGEVVQRLENEQVLALTLQSLEEYERRGNLELPQ